MDASVLDSIGTLLTTRNPLVESYYQTLKTIQSVWNLKRNRQQAELRIAYLNRRYQAIAVQVDKPKGQPTHHRMDCYR